MEERGIVARDCGPRLSSAGAPLPTPRHHRLGSAEAVGSGAPAGDNRGQQSLSPPCRGKQFHIDLKLKFNLDFRESKPMFLPPIQNAIQTRTHPYQSELYSAPDQTRYKFIPTPAPEGKLDTLDGTPGNYSIWSVRWCFILLCKKSTWHTVLVYSSAPE